MSSRKLAKFAAALTALVLLSGADGCKERPTVDTDRPPQDRQVDPKKARVALIIANSYGPYTVLVIAREVGKTGIDRTGPIHSAGGEYRQTLSYTSGLKIEINVTVTGSSNDVMLCTIVDGSNKVQDRVYGQAVCRLTTSR